MTVTVTWTRGAQLFSRGLHAVFYFSIAYCAASDKVWDQFFWFFLSVFRTSKKKKRYLYFLSVQYVVGSHSLSSLRLQYINVLS